MYYGYAGKILEVNLSTGKLLKKNLDRKIAFKFIGGLGLASKILYDEVGRTVEPLSPNNVVIIATGALTGTAAPTSNRVEVTTKSPLTGIIGTGNFGGCWGSRLKHAGYDAVVIRGVSNNPVYLRIDDDSVGLEKAGDIWGKDSWETTDTLKEMMGDDISVMAIGPAGENIVRFACPVIDYHHAPGRSHAGCVMGAKKLKAIAVRGTGRINVASPEEFGKAVKDVVDRIISYPQQDRIEVGSNYYPGVAAKLGRFAVRNFQSAIVPSSSEIGNLKLIKSYLREGPEYCPSCPMGHYYGCNLMADIKEGKYAGFKLSGVCFCQPAFDWGGKCEITSYPAMWKCLELCQRYGMDTVSAAAVTSFAMECCQRDILTEDDIDCVDLKWGNGDAIMEMLRKIAYREGFGDVLADGSVRAASRIGKGSEKYTYVLKGMELLISSFPSTIILTRLLGKMTCPRGGDDLKTTHTLLQFMPKWPQKLGMNEEEYLHWLLERLDMFEDVKKRIFGTPPRLDPYAPEGKAAETKWYGDLTSLFDSLGLCMFAVTAWSVMGARYMADLYTKCVGWHMTPKELMKTGERVFNLMKAYTVREGLTREDDHLPSKFYESPVPDGPAKGSILSKEKMNDLLDEYYDLRGWNKDTGIPTKRKLRELGLDDVADELSKMVMCK